MQRTAASRWGARGSYRGKSWRWSCGLHRRALSSAPPRRGSAELQRADADRAQATTGTRCAGKRLPPRSQLRCSAHSLPRFPLCGPSLPTSNRPRPISFLPPSPPNRGHLSASTPSPSGRRPGKVHKSSGCACGEFLPVPRTAIADTNTLLSGSEPRSEARCRYDVPSSVSLRRRKSIRPAGGTVLQPVHAVVWRGWRARAEAGDEDRSESCDSGP